jgi:3-phenylpropionate/trans-cinnamate dioxygenase ferredoxin reductase component
MSGLVVVGGSYAGLNIAAAARQNGFVDRIVMLTDEPHLPYNRPPLSKGFLLGAVDRETLPLRGEAFFRDNGIEVVFNARAETIDKAGYVETTAGRWAFDKLALATGTRARRIPLPGIDLDGVLTLRSLADADDIRARLADAGSVIIVGGGFIGLELAASMVKAGIQVKVVEGMDRVLSRVTGATMSSFIEAEFASHGAQILCRTGVESIEGANGKVVAVCTADGARHPADLVVLAVGAVPNIELADHLGLARPEGILVDAGGRTADPRIFAAGDCAFGMNLFAGRAIRLESVQNATDQGKAAGAAIAGAEFVNSTVPWFWSDQFDLKLQMVGLCEGAEREVVRGSLEDRKFSIFYLRGDRILAIDSVNRPGDNVLGRKLLAIDHAVSDAQIADLAFDLRALLG